jgi:hypothetical protein
MSVIVFFILSLAFSLPFLCCIFQNHAQKFEINL